MAGAYVFDFYSQMLQLWMSIYWLIQFRQRVHVQPNILQGQKIKDAKLKPENQPMIG